jgi:hypothetical protein
MKRYACQSGRPSQRNEPYKKTGCSDLSAAVSGSFKTCVCLARVFRWTFRPTDENGLQTETGETVRFDAQVSIRWNFSSRQIPVKG